MKRIIWLYAESSFTPWSEMVDTTSMIQLINSVSGLYFSTLMHYVDAKSAMASIIKSYDLVVNCVFGFKNEMQPEIAGWLDSLGVPHTSPNLLAQRIAQDKLATNCFSHLEGIKIPEIIDLKNFNANELLIGKPRFGGCHKNIKIGYAEELRADTNDIEMIYQKYLIGREFTVCVIPNQLLNDYVAFVGEIVPKPNREVFIAGLSYGKTALDCAPNITDYIFEKLKRVSIEIHKKLNLFAFSRIDFRMCEDELYVLDVNSMPNLHYQYSFTPRICEYNNISLQELMRRIIEFSLANRTTVVDLHFSENNDNKVSEVEKYVL